MRTAARAAAPAAAAAAGTGERYHAPPATTGFEQDDNDGARRCAATAAAAAAGDCFGPSAPDVEVAPRLGLGGGIRKPHTGMTIRLTPEILGRLMMGGPGPKPEIELVLKSAGEGGPVLLVGGVSHNLDAHQMAVGSEVHVLARTQQQQQPGNGSRHCGHRGEGGSQAGAGEAVEAGGKSGKPGMTVFASLHRKLIVQQVLTEAKRAEIRARNDEIGRREKQAKKKMVRMEDQEEMLAAAEAIPVPVGQTPPPPLEEFQQQSAGGTGTARRQEEGAAVRGSGGERRRRGPRRRDPLMAWVCGCYNDDDYGGHVSDLRQFFRGIDFHHVMFRYHVLPDGTLDPDRRRFCVRFKTKAGRDLAIKRSGEALGSYCSWWDPGDVATVIRGRDVGGDGRGGIEDMLVVLPQGRSVADVLEKVKARLPNDLTPALAAQRTDDDDDDAATSRSSKKRLRRHRKHGNDGDDDHHHEQQQLPESRL
ncbi:unnamed protein product, partial [Ectocarpus fasciculatus]